MSQEEFQKQVLRKFDEYESFQKQVLDSLSELKADSVELRTDVEKSNEKFEIYRQATQSIVNLAFGLIASATVITVISSVFKR
jgi:hypothetical protein